jgi:hypothetical protein
MMVERRIRRWLLLAALGFGLVCPGVVSAYQGDLQLVFGDIKRAVSGDEGSLNASNYRAIIDGIKTNLHCNGVRLYIDPNVADPSSYPQLYKDVFRYARSRGLGIYANPLGTGTFSKRKAQWADWIARYANHYRPEYLGPFNESGWDAGDTREIVDGIKSRLVYRPVLVGPDGQKVRGSIALLVRAPAVTAMFDVIASHNAAGDTGATSWAWRRLRQVAGKPTWASENPRSWSQSNTDGVEIGVKAVVSTAGPIEGLVIYLAHPYCMNTDGSLNAKGQAIADGIGGAPRR